jgi:hypothetical protein
MTKSDILSFKLLCQCKETAFVMGNIVQRLIVFVGNACRVIKSNCDEFQQSF